MKKYIIIKDEFYNIIMVDIARTEINNNHIIKFTSDKKEPFKHTRIYFGDFVKCIKLNQYNYQDSQHTWEYKPNKNGYSLDGTNYQYIDVVSIKNNPAIYEFDDDSVAELFCESIKGEISNE